MALFARLPRGAQEYHLCPDCLFYFTDLVISAVYCAALYEIKNNRSPRAIVSVEAAVLRGLVSVGAGSACDYRARRGSVARPADDSQPALVPTVRRIGIWMSQASTMPVDGTDRRQSQLLRRRSGAQGAAIVSVGAGSACDHWARRGSAARPADDSQPALVPTGAAHWSMDEPSTDDVSRRDGSQAEPAPTKAQRCPGCGRCFCRSRLSLRSSGKARLSGPARR